MKKFLSLLLAAVLLLSCSASLAGEIGQGGTMFVYTENGKTLNVRNEPRTGNNVIGVLPFGQKVEIVQFLDNGWTEIIMPGFTGGHAYVMSRFLSWYARPKPAPAPSQKTSPEKDELKTEVSLTPFSVATRASRSSGWVNLRKGPAKETTRITRYHDGVTLTCIGETTNWYKVMDPQNGYVGYIRKDFITVLPVPAKEEEAQIGRVNVNGDFTLTGKIPANYTLQVILNSGSHVIATLVSADTTKPKMIMNISYNEIFGDIKKLNDLSDEELAGLKETFSSMNSVAFGEKQTAAGTKLLTVTETGDDADFVIFYTIYNGYEIELTLAAEQNSMLKEDQIQTCVNFLSDLQFVPANSVGTTTLP